MPFPISPAGLQGALLQLLPHGGQRAARRNAWAAMAADATHARSRREAEAAVELAVAAAAYEDLALSR